MAFVESNNGFLLAPYFQTNPCSFGVDLPMVLKSDEHRLSFGQFFGVPFARTPRCQNILPIDGLQWFISVHKLTVRCGQPSMNLDDVPRVSL